MTLAGREVLCLELEWLILSRRAGWRPRDLEAIAELEVLREELDAGDTIGVKPRM